MNRRWVCNDVWMDIFPCFDRPQLGLKLALLSPRFNALVDKHFDGKSELTIWRTIEIRRKYNGPELKLSVRFSVSFLFPDRPLPSKIRFKRLQIEYIDHSVIAFLRLNQQIFDKRGTNLQLSIPSLHTTNGQRFWNVFAREIWPIFSANIRHLCFTGGDLDILRRLISPTILTDLNQLNSIRSHDLLPAAIGADFDVPNATISAGQALSKWLHSPRKDGQSKQLRCCKDYGEQGNFDWVNNFKEKFTGATISVSYQIHFSVNVPSLSMVPFELENELTNEKLTLAKAKKTNNWIMNRCKIIVETAAIQQQKKDENWDNNCNNVTIWLFSETFCIGPLSPPADQNNKNGANL